MGLGAQKMLGNGHGVRFFFVLMRGDELEKEYSQRDRAPKPGIRRRDSISSLS